MSGRAAEIAGCDYCGLPIAGAQAREPVAEKQYCCFGCRIAAAINDERGDAGAARATVTRLGLAVFFTLNESVFSMALWTGDIYSHDPHGGAMASTLEGLFRYLSLLFALPVLWLLGVPLADNALRDLRRGRFSVDLLLLAGVIASFAYSMWNVFRGAGQIYFEVGCVVLTLVTLGRWLEATGKLKTTESLNALERLLPDFVRVRRGERWIELPLAELAPGDVARVLPGERIPTDGRVSNTVVSVDEQLLTGESRPSIKEPGDELLGGSLNLDGDLWMEVTAPASAGTLARLIAAMRTARLRQGRYERMADRVAAWFTPVVAAIAIATFFGHSISDGWESGMLASLAVVLIACPCALGIATPMAIWAAFGRAAESQVLFRNGEALERLATVRGILFDKTGTLTTGVAELSDTVIHRSADAGEVARVAGALARGSQHVLSAALARALPGIGVDGLIDNIQHVPGRGLSATRLDTPARVFLGNLPFIQEQCLCLSGAVERRVRRALKDGESFTLLGWDGEVRAAFVFQEELRASAVESIRQCRALGLELGVLTGDHAARGAALERELGIRVDAELLPSQKLAAIERAQQVIGPVAMVGDGVNDAPAMAASDVGVAMRGGADLTRDAATVCLLGNDLTRLPWAIELSRFTMRVVRQNLFWAFAYNAIGIVLAAAGWLNPMWAAAAMVASSLFVVANSLRLRGNVVPVDGTARLDGDGRPRESKSFAPREEVAV